MPYAIDLFCGAGGFSEGILQAGFDILFQVTKVLWLRKLTQIDINNLEF